MTVTSPFLTRPSSITALWTLIVLIGDVEAHHVERQITREVDNRLARASNNFGRWQEPTERGDLLVEGAIAIVDVDIVPTALCRELFQVQKQRSGLFFIRDDPRAPSRRAVVELAIGEKAIRCI